jgi:monothiol glutaredoxin
MPLDPQIKSKIDGLVAQDPVVLFMKGTKSFPQCGFSASVVNILNTLVPKYATVNVLSDPDVRGGMKEYSDWPTFPQLFIKGEFVGGADIVRQMFESGELEKKLGDLVQAAKVPNVTVSPRAAKELTEALKEGSPGDVIHLTITAGWEHQLDIGGKEAAHITVQTEGITLQLDRASAARANGVSVDFVEDATGAGFKIENPNRPAMVRDVSPLEMKAMIESGKVKHVYDVRTQRERDITALPSSKLLDDTVMKEIEALPKDTALAFVCHHGNRSRGAADHFLKQGFKTVYNIAGGLAAWASIDPSIKQY